jgi:hypothetical protein
MLASSSADGPFGFGGAAEIIDPPEIIDDFAGAAFGLTFFSGSGLMVSLCCVTGFGREPETADEFPPKGKLLDLDIPSDLVVGSGMSRDLSQEIDHHHTHLSTQNSSLHLLPYFCFRARSEPLPARFDLGFDFIVHQRLGADQEVEQKRQRGQEV